MTPTATSRNRLVRLTGPALSASFVYDAVGRRIAKTINGVTTHFLYDGPDLAQEVMDGVPTRYLRLPFVDAPVARADDAYYLTDHLGSVLALTDATGAISTRYVYDPFGLATVEGAAADNPLQFTGRENDGTGLLYYRARYYAPALHRFLGQDLLPGLGANRYAYVGNSPLLGLDPFGLETLMIKGGSPSSASGPNPGLVEIGTRLSSMGEDVRPLFSNGQTDTVAQEACRLKQSGRPVFLIGHSWGGKAVIEVAQRMVEECGMAPDHVFTIDPWEAPHIKAPPGVPVTNFYQRRSWWFFEGPEVAGAVANIFIPGRDHWTITGHDTVRQTIEQIILEKRAIGRPLGGHYE